MPYFKFIIDNGASNDEIISSPDLRMAWKEVIDRFDDESLSDVVIEFEDEVTMPDGFEDETAEGGEEEGTGTR